MKKSTLFFVLAALTGLFLSSCSSFRDLNIEKRRYNKGFHVSVRDQKAGAGTSLAREQARAAVEQTMIVQEVPSVNDEPQAVAALQPLATAKPAAKAWAHARTKTESQSEPAAPSRAQVRKAVKEMLKRDSVSQEKNTQAPADSTTILLVILAILLPPVAVLIYEDGLTSKFWISLLLTLLLFLPGVIYSILVVTGTI